MMQNNWKRLIVLLSGLLVFCCAEGNMVPGSEFEQDEMSVSEEYEYQDLYEYDEDQSETSFESDEDEYQSDELFESEGDEYQSDDPLEGDGDEYQSDESFEADGNGYQDERTDEYENNEELFDEVTDSDYEEQSEETSVTIVEENSDSYMLDQQESTAESMISEVEEIETILESGTCGDSAIYHLTDDGVLSISGSGPVYNYSIELPAPWNELADYVTSVVISEGITSIGGYSFDGMNQIRRVTISSGVSEIESSAFRGCTSLQEILIDGENQNFTVENGVLFSSDFKRLICYPSQLPEGVYCVPDQTLEICEYAFYGQENLSELVLCEGIENIGENAFAECAALTDISMR